MKKTILLCVGSEILKGRVQDANFVWFSKFCSKRSINLQSTHFINDNIKDISKLINSSDADTIVITGGLGPTLDDLTKQALMAVLNTEKTIESESFLKICQEQYLQKNRVYDPSKSKYHHVHCAMEPLYNKIGYAPGIKLLIENKAIFAFPGVPREFQAMCTDHLESSTDIDKKTSILFKTYGVSESHIFDQLDPELWEDLDKLCEISCLPSHKGVDLWLSSSKSSKEQVIQRVQNSALKPYIWSTMDQSIEQHVYNTLKNKGLSISTCESCTGGLIAHTLTQVPGVSELFKGSIIAYQEELKVNILGIERDTLSKFGAVSGEVAREMARNSRKILKSDISISTTGFAGEVGNDQEDGGTVYIALAFKGGEIVKKFKTQNNREINKIKFANNALHMLIKYLQNQEV